MNRPGTTSADGAQPRLLIQMTIGRLLDKGTEAAAALADKRPVVALESTIITHGMPFPQNFETAVMLEETVRANGAVPATVAVVEGRLKAGLDGATLERLARLSGGVVKGAGAEISASARG